MVDAVDLPRLKRLKITWYANPARKSQCRKHYVNAKRWECAEQASFTVLMHRFLMDAPKGREVNHIDNDGLNNRRSTNLEFMTHIENMRWKDPERDWKIVDERRAVGVEYRKEREIAAKVQSEFNLCRQQLWKIRCGDTRGSRAAFAYRDAIDAANIRPYELITRDHPKSGKWGAERGF